MIDRDKLDFLMCPDLPSGVLRIKMGTNPNSSSIGTLLYALPVSLAAVGTIAGIVCAARRDGQSGPPISQGDDGTTSDNAQAVPAKTQEDKKEP